MAKQPAAPPRQQRRWTDAEDTILQDKYGLIPDAKLARKLGRSVNAVVLRARRCGIRHGDNCYNALQAGEALGVDSKTIALWIRQGILPAKKAPYKEGNRRQPWQILPADLETFVKTHPERLDPARMPDGWLRNLLRRLVPATHVAVTTRRWTAREDAYLLNQRGKKTQAEMAAYLRRSKEAVHYRLGLLRSEGRMVPYKTPWRTRTANGTATAPRPWTEAEDTFIRTHWGQLRADNTGKWGTRWTAAEIASELGRSLLAVNSRAGRLGVKNPNWHPPVEEQAAA